MKSSSIFSYHLMDMLIIDSSLFHFFSVRSFSYHPKHCCYLFLIKLAAWLECFFQGWAFCEPRTKKILYKRHNFFYGYHLCLFTSHQNFMVHIKSNCKTRGWLVCCKIIVRDIYKESFFMMLKLLVILKVPLILLISNTIAAIKILWMEALN